MLQDVLHTWGGVEVSPMEVYRDMFNLGSNEIQRKNETAGSFKANPIAYWKNAGETKGHFRIMFDDTFEETLEELQQADFAILNGLTYFGRKNLQEHASKMYALIFDIDGVTEKTLNAFLSGAKAAEAYPVPNYIVLSGHGVHLYYLLEYPVPLFPNIKLQLKELKYALTEKIWNGYTSTEKKKQFQGINQGFRVIGGRTKKDAPETTVKAYRLNQHPFSLDQLNRYVEMKNRIDETKLFKESKLTLVQAQKKYPEWYEKVVLNKDRTPRKWDIAGKVNGDNPYALYDWWIRQIKEGAAYGHRYFNIMCLAIYAVKCDVPEEKLWNDIETLMPFLNDLNPAEPFTQDDVDVALECYDLRYCTFPIKDIEKISGIPIPKNKRNGRKQTLHLRLARANRDILCEERGKNDWREGAGRPKGSGTAEQTVSNWRAAHPSGKKADCIRETGLTKPTVYKWWEAAEPKGWTKEKDAAIWAEITDILYQDAQEEKPREKLKGAMTAAKIEEYEKMVEGAEQMTFEDLL